jgi:hypothetical protein
MHSNIFTAEVPEEKKGTERLCKDIKMLGQGGLKGCSPWMSSFMELLDKCRDSDMSIWPSANFHHLSGRKCPFSVLNQACSCGVHHGSHLAKEHGNKAIRTARDGPLMRAACLASLSAFQFPWAIVASPFWCPQQCITSTCSGAHTASSRLRISYPYLILFLP